MADAKDPEFLQTLGLVVNCTKDIPFTDASIPRMRVPVHDLPAENAAMLHLFPRAAAAIDRAMRHNQQVLVHCHAGIQRSCAVTAAYIMYLNKKYNRRVSAPQAMKMVKRQKSIAFEPRPTFLPALHAYEERLRELDD